MGKIYTALGLMSGTSGDGVDASIISSDGINQYSEILNEYFKYDHKIHKNLHNLRGKILKTEDLKKNEHEINYLEKEIKPVAYYILTAIILSLCLVQIDNYRYH